MLGGETLGCLDPLLPAGHEHGAAARLEDRTQFRAGADGGKGALERCLDRGDERLVPGDEGEGAVRAVLCLRDQVGGDDDRIDALAGHDGDLARPCDVVDLHHSGDLPLGEGHVDVAGADDHLDAGDRRRAIGEGGDRLRPAHPVDLGHAGDVGCGERGGRHGSVGGRRGAERDLGHARHRGGDGAHEHGRGVGGTAAGDVDTGTAERLDGLADRGPSDGGRPRGDALVLGERPDTGRCLVHRVEESLGRRGGSRLDVALGDPHGIQAGAVVTLGQLPEGCVAPPADIGNDASDRFQRGASRLVAGDRTGDGGVGIGTEIDGSHGA